MNFLQILPENKQGQTSKFTLSSQYCPDTLIEKLYKDIIRNYRPIFLINMDRKIINEILVSQVQHYRNITAHNYQPGFIPGMQGWLNIPTAIDGLYKVKRLEKGNGHNIILMDIEKDVTSTHKIKI